MICCYCDEDINPKDVVEVDGEVYHRCCSVEQGIIDSVVDYNGVRVGDDDPRPESQDDNLGFDIH